MATRLHNTKFAIDYGEEMYLGDKTGYATFAELVDLASDLADSCRSQGRQNQPPRPR